LDDADLVVEPFNEAQRYFVFRFAVRSNPVVDHVGKCLKGFQPLPLELIAPIFKEPL
jgi:hypothetical protein